MKIAFVILFALLSVTPILAASDYIIKPGDTVVITVQGEPELKVDAIVSPKGKVTVNLVGEIQAAGLTAEQIQSAVESGLKEYIKKPVVNVKVTPPDYITVTGEVQRPGQYRYKDKMSLLDALALAGGKTKQGTLRKIELIRRTVTGEETTIVDFAKYLETADPKYDVILQPGDTICVPKSDKKQPGPIRIAEPT